MFAECCVNGATRPAARRPLDRGAQRFTRAFAAHDGKFDAVPAIAERTTQFSIAGPHRPGNDVCRFTGGELEWQRANNAVTVKPRNPRKRNHPRLCRYRRAERQPKVLPSFPVNLNSDSELARLRPTALALEAEPVSRPGQQFGFRSDSSIARKSSGGSRSNAMRSPVRGWANPRACAWSIGRIASILGPG